MSNDKSGSSGAKSDVKPLFDDIECEYKLLADLVSTTDVESLDDRLRKALKLVFSASEVEINSAGLALVESTGAVFESAGSEEHILISSGFHKALRDVIIHEGRTAPRRRFLDSVLQIYCYHYELLIKSQLDRLTGLYNRQVLEEKVKLLNGEAAFSTQRSNQINRVVVLLDIDHFKSINDDFGHLYGDEVLVIISQMMKSTFRLDDWMFRYGGEEFLVILNSVDVAAARCVIDRFVRYVAAHEFPQIGQVTISVGYTVYNSDKAFGISLGEADKALYYSKNNGRNQHHLYADLLESGAIESWRAEDNIDLF